MRSLVLFAWVVGSLVTAGTISAVAAAVAAVRVANRLDHRERLEITTISAPEIRAELLRLKRERGGAPLGLS